MRYRALALALFITTAPAFAQQPQRALTTDDYARAEQFLGQSTRPLVFGASVRPNWLESGRFWYRNTIPEGAEFVLVDQERRTRARAFDHERLAAALSALTDTTHDPFQLPFSTFHLGADGRSISFELWSQYYTCDIKDYRCTSETVQSPSTDPGAVTSLDGKHAAFIRDFNLWIRETDSGAETQLTFNGIEDFGYATNNAGWARSSRPVLLWSPDSKKIATFQHDGRGVGEMYLVSTNVGHPQLDTWKYPHPEDSVIFRVHRVVIHVEGPKLVRLQMPPDQHRSTVCDHIACRGTFADVEWSDDGSQLAPASGGEPEGQATARPWYNGRERVVLQHAPSRERTDSGQQGLRSHSLPEPRPRFGRVVHGSATLGLLRAPPDGRGAAAGVRVPAYAPEKMVTSSTFHEEGP
jgi:hypothetical protein